MTKYAWLAGAALLQVAGAAHGQSLVTAPGSVPPLTGVSDRVRPEYRPIGGRLGSFFLYPRLDLSAQHSDNLRAAETNPISDVTFEAQPSVDLVSNWTRHYLDLRGYYAKNIHAKTGDEDFSRYGVAGASRLDFGRDTHLFLNANADQAVEPRTNINSVNASRSPIRYTDVGGGARLSSTFNRLTLSGSTFVNVQRFSNAETVTGVPIDQKFRNNRVIDSTIEARYQLGASTSAILHLERSEIRYTSNRLTGLNRNSIGYTVQAGLGLRVTNLISGDIRVGYLTQNNRNPVFLDTSGIAFSVNLVYNIRPTTTIRLFADRSIEPGGSAVTTGNVRSTGAVTVEHELLRNLILTGYGRYASIDPQGPFSSAKELEGRAGATYLMSRRVRLNASYDHYRRRGNSFGRFDVNAFTLGTTLTL